MSDMPHRFPVVDIPSRYSTSASSVVTFLVGELVRLKHLQTEDTAEIVRLVLRREELGSTGVGRGVAIPHCSTPLVTNVVGVIGRCAEPMVWKTADHAPVGLVCLLVSPTGPDGLRALEELVRQLRYDPPFG